MSGDTLSPETHRQLLEHARATIAHAVGAGPKPTETVPEGAAEHRGCFVTLHTESGDLRGCIGTFTSERSLWDTVRDMAIASATRDPRFQPVAAEELDGCVLEISALTAKTPAKPEEVEVGRHGVCVARGAHRGVLLPQVATDHGWNRETFLDHTCLKAGLPADAWRDGSVTIEVFSAEVFSE
ncbi:MAG: AmmeMemoRadiSam system protein A [Myxococcota bacterium]